MRYAAGRVWEEVAYLAYYLHWSLEEILDLPHPVRDLVIGEVGKIHNQLSGESGADDDQPGLGAG